MTSNRATNDTGVLLKLLVVDNTYALNASRAQSSLTHKHAHMTAPKRLWNASEAWITKDTEAGMLSGVSRKRSIRSNPCWFTEFCKSQCLSHFAAPFIVVRAETSVAESCEEAYKHLTINAKEKIQRHNVWSKTVTAGQERKKSKPNLPPPRPHERNKSQVRSHFRRFKWSEEMRVNDPSAGSPTETLLRLLLPLSDKVH